MLHLFRFARAADGTLCRVPPGDQPRRSHAIEVPLSIRFDADFADIFEVRGTRRRTRRLAGVGVRAGRPVICGIAGSTASSAGPGSLQSSRPPDQADERSLFFLRCARAARLRRDRDRRSAARSDGRSVSSVRYADAVGRRAARSVAPDRRAGRSSSNYAFNRWVGGPSADLRMMITETAHGPYPYAGIPWFSTPFGRDGIITALELLWAAPDVARGVLDVPGRDAGDARRRCQDAQPGKILHEMRDGEMAALGEVPFGRYYGSADATPLFVMLAHAYFERTGDLRFIDRCGRTSWRRSTGWTATATSTATASSSTRGAASRARPAGLEGLVGLGVSRRRHAGRAADRALRDPGLRLRGLERRGAAGGRPRRHDAGASAGSSARPRCRQRFEQAFWCDDLGTYALALDARQAAVPRAHARTPATACSPASPAPARARAVAETLMADASFSGWGIRTVASGTARYNPMSYHNGSVWPHDNAIVAAGFARYGFTATALAHLHARCSTSARSSICIGCPS